METEMEKTEMEMETEIEMENGLTKNSEIRSRIAERPFTMVRRYGFLSMMFHHAAMIAHHESACTRACN